MFIAVLLWFATQPFMGLRRGGKVFESGIMARAWRCGGERRSSSGAPEPILDFAYAVSDAVPVVPPRWTLSLPMPSQEGANAYAEHLGGRCSIHQSIFKIRPTPPPHIVLLGCPLFATIAKAPFAIAKDR